MQKLFKEIVEYLKNKEDNFEVQYYGGKILVVSIMETLNHINIYEHEFVSNEGETKNKLSVRMFDVLIPIDTIHDFKNDLSKYKEIEHIKYEYDREKYRIDKRKEDEIRAFFGVKDVPLGLG
jgi:hypothetical protein